METTLLAGIITNTSKKQSGEFESKNPRKTIYLELDAENTAKAEAFGLTKYTSKKDKKDFFMVKASAEVKIYDLDGNVTGIVSGKADDESNNFTSDDSVVYVSLMRSEKSGNKFSRLYAILGDVVENAPENPFASITDKTDF